MSSPTASLFLSAWSEIDESESDKQKYIDYEALINSDDEWLILESLVEVGRV